MPSVSVTVDQARFPKDFPTLQGKTLVLRALCDADIPAWFERLNDAESLRLSGDGRATSLEQVASWVEAHHQAFANNEAIRWGIVPQGSEHAVGSIGLMDVDLADLRADLGGVVGRAHWNQGLMTQAGRLVRDFAFNTMNLQRLQADLLADNLASKAVMHKLEFQQEAVIRNYRQVDNKMVDGLLYAGSPMPRTQNISDVRAQYHSRKSGGDLLIWNVRRLIQLSADLPRIEYPLAKISDFEANHWYQDSANQPTPASILEHMQLIDAVDLRYPIILNSEGGVMDGMHRVARAHREGRRWLYAVQFEQDPEPDYKNLPPEGLSYD